MGCAHKVKKKSRQYNLWNNLKCHLRIKLELHPPINLLYSQLIFEIAQHMAGIGVQCFLYEAKFSYLFGWIVLNQYWTAIYNEWLCRLSTIVCSKLIQLTYRHRYCFWCSIGRCIHQEYFVLYPQWTFLSMKNWLWPF